MKTVAAVYEAGSVSVKEVELARPGPREVHVRVLTAGICHSDVQIASGASRAPKDRPIVLGHEACVEVLDVGAGVRSVEPGRRAVIVPPGYCGACEDCLDGRTYVCRVGAARQPGSAVVDGRGAWPFLEAGVFAEHAVVHESLVAPLPTDCGLSNRTAAYVGCSVVTGAGAVLNTARVRPGSTVAVLGCGGVGLVAVMAATFAGANVIAVDLTAGRLARARGVGARAGVVFGDDAARDVRAATGGRGVDYAFECSGSVAAMRAAVAMLAPSGTAVLVGVPSPGSDVAFQWTDVRLDQRVLASRMGSNRGAADVRRYAELWNLGKLKIQSVLDYGHVYVGVAAFADALGAVAAGKVSGRAVVEIAQ